MVTKPFRRLPRLRRFALYVCELLRWCRYFRRFPAIGSLRRWQLRVRDFLRPLQESTRGREHSKALREWKYKRLLRQKAIDELRAAVQEGLNIKQRAWRESEHLRRSSSGQKPAGTQAIWADRQTGRSHNAVEQQARLDR